MQKTSRLVKKTRADSLLVGKMPRGCQLCVKGAKLVLFVTGICKRGCFYCPLSDRRKNRDVVFANERPVESPREVIEEARQMDALGTGVTGGDPSARYGRALKYIRLLKSKFGKEHHIHMYCCEPFSMEKLKELKEAGLDEIRFHLWSAAPVRTALEAGLDAGVELPVEPGSYGKIVGFFRELDDTGCDFVNLNELEFSDTNLQEFRSRGFTAKEGDSVAVEGSKVTATKILRWGAKNVDFSIHYCPSSLKDSVQLKNRLKRKSRNVAMPHEEITDEGLLFKGVVLNFPVSKLVSLRRRLVAAHGINPKLIAINGKKGRLETHWRLAKALAKREPGLRFALVEEYPTYDGLETTVISL